MSEHSKSESEETKQGSTPAPEKKGGLTRRQMLELGGTGLAAAVGVGAAVALYEPDHYVPGISDFEKNLPKLKTFNVERPKTAPAFTVAHGNDVDKMVAEAVGALGGEDGVSAFIKPGDVVIVKPNVAFDRAPKYGATTNPAVLAAVCKVIAEAGAKEIRVLDNPINQPQGCFVKSGIMAETQKLQDTVNARLELILPGPSQFETIHVGGPVLKTWPMFYKPFKDADKVVGVAPLKDHNLCHASMTMKNWYGLLGGRRNQFHQDIYGIIADLAFMMTPTFVVLDATKILMRNGPTGGSVADVKDGQTIVAGVDNVAVDAYGGEVLLERKLDDLEYLRQAHEREIGRMDWKSLNYREFNVG